MAGDSPDSRSDQAERTGAWQDWEIAELKRRRASIDYLNRHAESIYRPERQDEPPAEHESRPPAS